MVSVWGARGEVRGPLRGKGGRTSRRAFRRELGWGAKHEREVRMWGVEVGGQAASRRTKVRVVPVHLQHHHLNLFLSNCFYISINISSLLLITIILRTWLTRD